MTELRFDENGLIPAIIQQHDTGEVLMLAYMNEESLSLTISTETTWFWSRSRRELWNKGATSGNVQKVIEVLYDCDSDCLLVKVDSSGPACHTGKRSCFYREYRGQQELEHGGREQREVEQQERKLEQQEHEQREVEHG